MDEAAIADAGVRLTELIQSIALIEMEPVDSAGRDRVCRSPSVGARCIWIAVLTIFDPESTGLPDGSGTAEYMKGLVKANVKNRSARSPGIRRSGQLTYGFRSIWPL